MIMNRFFQYRRCILSGLLPLLAALFLYAPAYAGVGPDGSGRIAKSAGVTWNLAGDLIVIKYDLINDPDARLTVDLLLRSESDSSFSAVPQAIEGDVGEGYFGGTNREIRWQYRRDFPEGFDGEGYFFEIRVQEHETSASGGWMYYALGAAAVAGGMLAFVISRNQEELTPVGSK